MINLETKNCAPCAEGAVPFTEKEEYEYLGSVHGWSLNKKQIHHIRKLFAFASFAEAIGFVNKVAELAEADNHHPDIFISYRHVTVSLWTKKIGGLSENDFIMAAKIDQLPLPN